MTGRASDLEPDNGVTDAAIDRILGGGGICFLTTIRAAEGWDAAGAIVSALARGDCWSANVLIAGREFARRCRRVATRLEWNSLLDERSPEWRQ